jgi:LysM repeat protein
MPAAARAERRGSRRRPFVLATLATTAMGAPTLMAVPSIAAEATTVENLTPTHVSAPAPARTAPSATFGLAQAANVQHLPARVTPVRQENSSSSYEVRSGDTLIGIAAANGTTVAALRSANGISGSPWPAADRPRRPPPRAPRRPVGSTSSSAVTPSSGSRVSTTRRSARSGRPTA